MRIIILVNEIEQSRKHSSLCRMWHQSTCYSVDAHTRVHKHAHTHAHGVHARVLSTELQRDVHFSLWLTVKEYKSRWLISSRPRPGATTEKTRPPSEANTRARRPLSRSHLDDTASQSWPSPLGRWPVRPTTEGRGLLLPGEGF